MMVDDSALVDLAAIIRQRLLTMRVCGYSNHRNGKLIVFSRGDDVLQTLRETLGGR